MQLRKFFATLASLAIAFSIVAPAANAAFSDQSSIPSWATSAVDQLVADGVISGYADGRFGPNDPLTRAQFAKIAVLASNTPVQSSVSDSGFPDVPASHWAAPYVKAAQSAGIINGYQNGNFGPNDTVTRGQAAKILVGAFGLASHTEMGPNFPDVSSSMWEYSYVETAYYWSVINGYQNGNFGPFDPVTRAQVAVMTVGSQNPEVRPEFLADDDLVPANKLGINSVAAKSATSVELMFNKMVQEASAEDIDNYMITGSTLEVLAAVLGSDGKTVTLTTASQVSGHDYVLTASDISTADGSMMIDESYDSLGFIGFVTAVSTNSFVVSVSPSSPVASSIPQNANNVPFLVIDLKAGAQEDVKVSKIVIERRGLGNDADFDNIFLYDGATRLTNGRKFSSENHTATFNLYNPFVIPAGRTKSITVTGSMSGNNNKVNYLQVAFPEDIVAVGDTSGGAVTVSGNFPVRGAEMTTVNVESATVTIDNNGVVNDSAKIGDMQAEFGLFRLDAAAEDVLVTSMTFENKGNGSENIANINLYDGLSGDKLVSLPTIGSNDRVVFDLTGLTDGGYYIKKGDRGLFSIKADVVNARGTADKINFDLDDKSDILAIGQTYGYGANVVNSLTDGISGVAGGVAIASTDLVFNWQRAPFTDVAGDQNDVILGYLDITNRSEDVLMNKMRLDILAKDATAAWIADDIADLLDNIELVDPSGAVVAGPVTPSDLDNPFVNTQNAYVDFTDNWLIPTGSQSQRYVLRADILSANLDGNNYQFTMKTTNSTYFDAEGNVTGNTIDTLTNVTPSQGTLAGITSNTVTIQEATLTVALSSTPASQTVVAGNTIPVFGFTLTANDSGALKVTKIPVNFYYQGSQANISVAGYNVRLEKEDGTLLSEKALQGTVNFDSFLQTITIPSGGQQKFIVKMNTSTSAANGSVVSGQIEVDDIVVQDAQFNALNDDQKLPDAPDTINPFATATVKMTLVTGGTLTVRLDTNTPISDQVMLGAQGVELMRINFGAVNEAVNLKQLRIEMANTNTGAFFNAGTMTGETVAGTMTGDTVDEHDSIIDKLYLYQGSTLVGTAVGINTNQAEPGYFLWTWTTNRPVVPRDGELVLSVKADLNVSNNNAAIVNGLVDAPAFRIAVPAAYVEAEGSQNAISQADGGLTFTDSPAATDYIASNWFYPYDTLPFVELSSDVTYGNKGAPFAGMPVFGFTVTSASNAEDVRTQYVVLDHVTIKYNGTGGIEFGTLTLYDYVDNSTIDTQTVNANSGSATFYFAGADNSDRDIAEGQTKRYAVKTTFNNNGTGDRSLSMAIEAMGGIGATGAYSTGNVAWSVKNGATISSFGSGMQAIRQTPSDISPNPMLFSN